MLPRGKGPCMCICIRPTESLVCQTIPTGSGGADWVCVCAQAEKRRSRCNDPQKGTREVRDNCRCMAITLSDSVALNQTREMSREGEEQEIKQERERREAAIRG